MCSGKGAVEEEDGFLSGLLIEMTCRNKYTNSEGALHNIWGKDVSNNNCLERAYGVWGK